MCTEGRMDVSALYIYIYIYIYGNLLLGLILSWGMCTSLYVLFNTILQFLPDRSQWWRHSRCLTTHETLPNAGSFHSLLQLANKMWRPFLRNRRNIEHTACRQHVTKHPWQPVPVCSYSPASERYSRRPPMFSKFGHSCWRHHGQLTRDDAVIRTGWHPENGKERQRIAAKTLQTSFDARVVLTASPCDPNLLFPGRLLLVTEFR
jgi:hypothetical protein